MEHKAYWSRYDTGRRWLVRFRWYCTCGESQNGFVNPGSAYWGAVAHEDSAQQRGGTDNAASD